MSKPSYFGLPEHLFGDISQVTIADISALWSKMRGVAPERVIADLRKSLAENHLAPGETHLRQGVLHKLEKYPEKARDHIETTGLPANLKVFGALQDLDKNIRALDKQPPDDATLPTDLARLRHFSVGCLTGCSALKDTAEFLKNWAWFDDETIQTFSYIVQRLVIFSSEVEEIINQTRLFGEQKVENVGDLHQPNVFSLLYAMAWKMADDVLMAADLEEYSCWREQLSKGLPITVNIQFRKETFPEVLKAVRKWPEFNKSELWSKIRAAIDNEVNARAAGGGGGEREKEPDISTVFKRDSEIWVIAYAGQIWKGATHHKALMDVHCVLTHEGEKVEVTDLPGNKGNRTDMKSVRVATMENARELVKQILVLKDELEREDNEVIKQETQDQIDALNQQYNRDFGKRGYPRRLLGDMEKMVAATRKRYNRFLEGLGERNADLVRHFEKHLTIGSECIYDPEPPVLWDLGD